MCFCPLSPIIKEQLQAERDHQAEIKARAAVASGELTQNEWFKAERFGQDYYLYVVLNAATQPQLYIIQDPAANLRPEERLEVRYRVDAKEILRQAPAIPSL